MPEDRSVQFKTVRKGKAHIIAHRRRFGKTPSMYYVFLVEQRNGCIYGTELERAVGGKSWTWILLLFNAYERGDIPTEQQLENAILWFEKHEKHVLELVEASKDPYPPSVQDAAYPQLWKPEHWWWLLKRIGY